MEPWMWIVAGFALMCIAAILWLRSEPKQPSGDSALPRHYDGGYPEGWSDDPDEYRGGRGEGGGGG